MQLGFNTKWEVDFLTGRPQAERVSTTKLCSELYTHDCDTTSDSNHVKTFANHTAVVGLIGNHD